ncbi:MAG: SRPBCC family protein [Actinobacteria bacterium]|nr:SRPBCC family protein [Actinomycetota bacterium]
MSSGSEITNGSGKATVRSVGERQIEVVREFDAPRHLVFRAYTEPDLIKRWWAGRRGTVTVAEVDLRVGGAWRYAMTAEGGFEVAFRGEYREVVADERLVYTEIFEMQPDEGAVTTVTFEEREGRTVLTMVVEMPSTETRDLMAGQMEAGVQEGFDILEEIAREL